MWFGSEHEISSQFWNETLSSPTPRTDCWMHQQSVAINTEKEKTGVIEIREHEWY